MLLKTMCFAPLLGLCQMAIAGQFLLAVEVDCDKNQNKLDIYFKGYEGHEGERAIEQLGEVAINPLSLVEIRPGVRGQVSNLYTTKSSLLAAQGAVDQAIDLGPTLNLIRLGPEFTGFPQV